MTNPPPKKAKELVALIESLLAALPKNEQDRFWLLITEHKSNSHYQEITDFWLKTSTEVAKILFAGMTKGFQLADTTYKQLKKHRRPPRNAERDAEIMKLRAKNKTAGEIVFAMNGRYQLTDTVVRAVISRKRKKPKND